MSDVEHIDHNRTHDLTIREIKDCPTFSDCTDEESLEVIETLKKLTTIAYNYYQKQSQILEK